jgi:hypothetical protein
MAAVLPIPEFKCSFVMDKNLSHRRLKLTGIVFARTAWCFGKTMGTCGETAEIRQCMFEYSKQVSK